MRDTKKKKHKILYKENYVIRPTQIILLPAKKMVNRNVTQNYMNNIVKNCKFSFIYIIEILFESTGSLNKKQK